jgi:hypothetical protein
VGLLENKNPALAGYILDSVNRQTLGQLLKSANNHLQSFDSLDSLLTEARNGRNRLSHSFYRGHNFRGNSDEGRTLMLTDLDTIHSALPLAYKAVLALSGVDLDAIAEMQLQRNHLPI